MKDVSPNYLSALEDKHEKEDQHRAASEGYELECKITKTLKVTIKHLFRRDSSEYSIN